MNKAYVMNIGFRMLCNRKWIDSKSPFIYIPKHDVGNILVTKHITPKNPFPLRSPVKKWTGLEDIFKKDRKHPPEFERSDPDGQN